MNDEDLLKRIVVDPAIMVGQPIIRGTRLTVAYILGLLAHGAMVGEILDDYPGLAQEDIQAGLLFANQALSQSSFMPLVA